MKPNSQLMWLALLTAIAASINVIESWIMRLFPIPFLRIGLSNGVVLYLVCKHQFRNALIVTMAKVLLGGLVTFTLLSPSTLLAVGGGISALLCMHLAYRGKLGFSIFGISIFGAIAHNLAQLILVRYVIIKSSRVFMLTPMLILIALISGSIVAYIVIYADAKFKLPGIGNK